MKVVKILYLGVFFSCILSNAAELEVKETNELDRLENFVLSFNKQLHINKQLFNAISKGSLDDVKKSLENGASLTSINLLKEYNTPLFAAIYAPITVNKILIIELLLKKGANPNDSDVKGKTPLSAALTLNEIVREESNQIPAIVKLLLDFGADVNKPSGDGYTPIMEARNRSTPDLINLLIKNGADVNAYEEEDASTALIQAAERADNVAVRALLSAGADINHRDNEGETAYEVADRLCNAETAEIIKSWSEFMQKGIEKELFEMGYSVNDLNKIISSYLFNL